MKLCKDGMIKDLESPKVIERWKRKGWAEVGATVEPEDLEEMDIEALKARAGELGLTVHPRTGAKKLAEMIAEAEAE